MFLQGIIFSSLMTRLFSVAGRKKLESLYFSKSKSPKTPKKA